MTRPSRGDRQTHLYFSQQQLAYSACERVLCLPAQICRQIGLLDLSMDLSQRIEQQRIKYIIASYQLDSPESERFQGYLDALCKTYSSPLIELALVETLVDQWVSVPLLRGLPFLDRVHGLLQQWQQSPVRATITPEQFQAIAGLDPQPIFGSAENPTAVCCPASRLFLNRE